MIATAKTKSLKPLNPRSPDTKYMGEEPLWKIQPTDNRNTELGRALHWYGYFYGKKEAKDFIASYLDRHDRTRDAKKIRSMPDSHVRLTAGWLCRMADVGLVLTEHEQIKLDNMLAEIFESAQDKKAETVPEETVVAKPNIQDRLRDRVIECAGELEGLFDEFVENGAKMSADWKPITTIRGMNVAPQMISVISDIWKKKLEHYKTVAEAKDAQLVEAYSNYSKIQLRNVIKFCETVINDCGSYVQIKKVERKPRKKKPVSLEKQTAKFKYLREFPELKLISEPATKLVGAAEAWLYDTKKRKLIHLIADQHIGTFGVKGTTIIGFDPNTSVQKTLRKPAEQVKALMSASVPAARKFFKDIKATDTRFNGRGNENIVILKVK